MKEAHAVVDIGNKSTRRGLAHGSTAVIHELMADSHFIIHPHTPPLLICIAPAKKT
jgi:hypothetical protein